MRSLALVTLLLVVGPANAQEGNIDGLPKPWMGVVSKVVDGDGIYVAGSDFQIRLFGVDAPENGQTGFEEARTTLAGLADGNQVRVDPQYWQPATSRYKARIVARVWIGAVEVNKQVIEQGPATEYCKYSKGIYGHC